MALVEPPPALRDVSITVMCGPFFCSCRSRRRGSRRSSHVAYTPHYEWTDDPRDPR